MSGRALPPARLLAVVAPVSLVGVAAYLAATFTFFRDPGSCDDARRASSRFSSPRRWPSASPCPVEDADANGVSLGFVFAVAALVLFGWAPATLHLRHRADAGRADRAATRRSARSSTPASSGSSAAIAGLVLSQMNGTERRRRSSRR